MDSKLVKIIKKIVRRLDPRRKIFLDLNNYRNTIFIAGAPRSGTSWLQDMVNYKQDRRIVFEPFHSEHTKEVNYFHFRQYLRSDNREEKYLAPARDILSGNIRNSWVDNYNKKFLVRKRIVKDVRTNLMLKWIKTHFPEIPIIYIMRHPCAVALSRRERGFNTHLDVYLTQNQLMMDHLQPFEHVINNAKDTFDKHIIMWCIDNYVPLQQFLKGEMHIVFYEHLCIRSNEEIKKIFRFLNIPGDINDPVLQGLIKKPSLLSRDGSAIFHQKNLIDGWKAGINEAETKRAVELLKLFSLDRAYDAGPLPRIDDGNELLASASI